MTNKFEQQPPEEKDIPYKPIHIFEDEKSLEQTHKINILGIERDERFLGALIIKTQEHDNQIIGYALTEDDLGKISGHRIEYDRNSVMVSNQVLSETDIDDLTLKGVIKVYKEKKHEEEIIQSDDVKTIIIKTCLFGGSVNPFADNSHIGEMINSAIRAFENLSVVGQDKVVKHFFDDIISSKEKNKDIKFSVYYIFKDTPFGEQLYRKLLETGHNLIDL